MRRLLPLIVLLCLGLVARAQDRVNWEITPRTTAPGQPFRLQIQVEADVVLGGAQAASREIKPPRGMALRLSGQIFRADSNEATLNFSGVAPEEEGEYIIPAFNLRFARKVVAVPAIKLIVSKAVVYRRESQARAELLLPDRTFFVGELIRGELALRGGDEEFVVAGYGLESLAEGFTLTVNGERQILPSEQGQGLRTTFDLTPIRAGETELLLNGIMLVQSGEIGSFNPNGRDRPYAIRRPLKVEHVPERGRPADWNGAIGTFVAEAVQLSKDTPEIGEPIRLRAILTGDGNLDRIIPPELRGDETWDVLPAIERRRGVERQRIFVYTLVPRLPGKLRTPGFRIATFDPLTRLFSRVEFAPVEVTVTGTAPAKVELVTTDPAAPAEAKQRTITALAPPEPGRARSILHGEPARPLAAVPAFWSGNGLALTLLLAATGTMAFLGYVAAHPEIGIRRRARARLRSALIATADPQAVADPQAFAFAAVRGLQAGTAALLGAEDEAMTQSDVERTLPDVDRALLDTLFAAAHSERFSLAPAAGDIGRAQEARALLRRLLALL